MCRGALPAPVTLLGARAGAAALSGRSRLTCEDEAGRGVPSSPRSCSSSSFVAWAVLCELLFGVSFEWTPISVAALQCLLLNTQLGWQNVPVWCGGFECHWALQCSWQGLEMRPLCSVCLCWGVCAGCSCSVCWGLPGHRDLDVGALDILTQFWGTALSRELLNCSSHS